MIFCSALEHRDGLAHQQGNAGDGGIALIFARHGQKIALYLLAYNLVEWALVVAANCPTCCPESSDSLAPKASCLLFPKHCIALQSRTPFGIYAHHHTYRHEPPSTVKGALFPRTVELGFIRNLIHAETPFCGLRKKTEYDGWD